MDTKYYNDQLPVILEMTEKSFEKQYVFFQYILLVASSSFGILISLHGSNLYELHTQILFALSILTLSLGILSISVVLYDFSHLLERCRQDFVKETQCALKEDRAVVPVFSSWKKRTIILRKSGFVFLALALLFLTSYSLCLIF